MSWLGILLLLLVACFVLSLVSLALVWWLEGRHGEGYDGESVWRDALVLVAGPAMYAILCVVGLYEVLRVWLTGGNVTLEDSGSESGEDMDVV